MRKNYLYYKLALVALTVFAVQSCSKDNGINNTSVIATPYSLYYGDSSGTLQNSNDGVRWKQSIFPSDGVPSLAILAVGQNLMWIKSGAPTGTITAHISTNEGVNFNTSYAPLNPASFDYTLALYARDQNRVYIATATGINSGIMYNEDGGLAGHWQDDGGMDLTTKTGITITSFTQLKNNTVVAFDWRTRRIFTRPNATAPWTEQPPDPTHLLPGGSRFTIGHYNNTIVMVDRLGVNGAWYSDNGGVSWFKYNGLPNVPLYAVASPFDQGLLIGTQGSGVYVLQGADVFVPANYGLDKGVWVYGFTAKENIYVNGVSVQFVYMATKQGLFRCMLQQGLGPNMNWDKVVENKYCTAVF